MQPLLRPVYVAVQNVEMLFSGNKLTVKQIVLENESSKINHDLKMFV